MAAVALLAGVQAVPAVWTCDTCGADVSRACAAPRPPCRIDAEMVILRLEQAGEALLAMRAKSPFPEAFRCAMPEPVREVMDAYGYTEAEARPAVPSAHAISRMDVAYGWLRHIPEHRRVLRRIVAVRSLVDPLNGRHLVSWRRLGVLVRADHHAVERWHGQGIATIVQRLWDGPSRDSDVNVVDNRPRNRARNGYVGQ